MKSMRRMDRYIDETIEPKLTRSDQNKELYDFMQEAIEMQLENIAFIYESCK